MINVAQLGYGYWGPNLVRNLSLTADCRVRYVVDPSPSSRERIRAAHPQVEVLCGHEAVLSDGLVQAVVIATPAETHYQLAHSALQAGKDVLVEKPLALTAEEGACLVRRADEGQRILMVGHVLEYHPGIIRLTELVRNGELGKLRYIYSNRLSLGKVRREENILWSFAPHDVAVILRLTGSMPHQVSASGGSYLQPNIADVTVTNLAFNDEVRAHIFVSWLHPFKEQRLVVIGSRRMASFDDVAKRLVLYDQRVDFKEGEPIPVKGEGEEIAFSSDEPLYLECAAFVEAIRNRMPPITDGASGLRVLRVLEAAQRSLSSGGDPVSVAVGITDLEG